MVLRNGWPNDILSVSRDARANSTSQSTALFPTVLAGCATLAICIGKSRYPFDATWRASHASACMYACMQCSLARMRPRAPTISVRCVPAEESPRGRRNTLRNQYHAAEWLPPEDLRDAKWRDGFSATELLVVDSVSSTSSIFSRPN